MNRGSDSNSAQNISLRLSLFVRTDSGVKLCGQDRQCTYNVALRRVHITIVAVEKQYVLYISVCVCARKRARTWVSACACARVCGYTVTGTSVCLRACSLTYPVCQQQAPYCLRPLASPYFSTLSHKQHGFQKKKLLNIKCVFI